MAAQFVLLICSLICTFIEALPRGRGGGGRSGAAAGGGAGKPLSYCLTDMISLSTRTKWPQTVNTLAVMLLRFVITITYSALYGHSVLLPPNLTVQKSSRLQFIEGHF